MERPQVREAGVVYRSKLYKFLRGHSEVVERQATEMYARGLSTRDVEAAFTDERGDCLLSRRAVSEVTETLWERVHGVSREAVLCGWAITVEGRKVLLSLALGGRESYDAWREFLRDLVNRGLKVPLTITSDGAPGLIRAVEETWPKSLRLRCWVHRTLRTAFLQRLPPWHRSRGSRQVLNWRGARLPPKLRMAVPLGAHPDWAGYMTDTADPADRFQREPPLSADGIAAAHEALKAHLFQTPLLPSPRLKERTGANVYLKAENIQRTGSFKVRGSVNKLRKLVENGAVHEVTAASAGNHRARSRSRCSSADDRWENGKVSLSRRLSKENKALNCVRCCQRRADATFSGSPNHQTPQRSGAATLLLRCIARAPRTILNVRHPGTTIPTRKASIPLSLVPLLLALTPLQTADFTWSYGGIVRGSLDTPVLALVFTGDEFGEGTAHIREVLRRHGIKGSFFFTGRYYRNAEFADDIRALKADGHYLGAHSDQHLLYCSWEDRDSLLVTRDEFVKDILDNYAEMARFGVAREEAPIFMPAYEWYNDQISAWTNDLHLTLINYSPGTRSHADYTTPDLEYYISSDAIMQSITRYETQDRHGLNGFILLSHVGTAPERTDKFYLRLEELINVLKDRGYGFRRIDELLSRSTVR